MRDLSNIKNLIIKIGSSSLCDDEGNINKEKILNLIQQIAYIKRKGISITLVSSGAINAGVHVMNLECRPQTIPQKQALAAIGQASLMQIYEDLFSLFNLKCAQILLNHDDFDDRKRLMNFNNAMQALIEYDVVPIINENDTLAVEEIKVGDNDTLAALIVPVVEADMLILVSDIDGLYTANPHVDKDAQLIKFVDYVDDDIRHMAGDTSSGLGTGGMATKIRAAKIVNDYGSHLVIVNGQQENSILHIFDEHESGTWFNGKSGVNMNAKVHWLTYRTSSKGCIVVDEGAAEALQVHRKSLLPKGIVNVQEHFMRGQVVDIMNVRGEKIAKGISNYSSEEIKLIMGHQSCEIESILHYKDYDVVVHANNMVIIGGDCYG